jgi:hypothetical protein
MPRTCIICLKPARHAHIARRVGDRTDQVVDLAIAPLTDSSFCVHSEEQSCRSEPIRLTVGRRDVGDRLFTSARIRR